MTNEHHDLVFRPSPIVMTWTYYRARKRGGNLVPHSERVLSYFIQAVVGGPVKIGQSENPWSRVKELQTANSDILHIVHLSSLTESALHTRFKNNRKRGEWFYPDPSMLTVAPIATPQECFLAMPVREKETPRGEYKGEGYRSFQQKLDDMKERVGGGP